MPRTTPKKKPLELTGDNVAVAETPTPKKSVSKDVVRNTNKPRDAAEAKIGQDKPRDLPTFGLARLDEPEIEPVQGFTKSHADMLKFMEEPVMVRVHPTAEVNPEPIFGIWNNGRSQYFIRGQTQTVRRKFVEGLARARNTVYRQEVFRDANGDTAIRNIPSTALRYPFSVVRDDNPNGGAWLAKVLDDA